MQYVFDKVITHLLEQGQQSRTSSGCTYRDDTEGKVLKCAVGCLIDDQYYNPIFEGQGSTRLLVSTKHQTLSSDPQVQAVFNAAYEEISKLEKEAEIKNAHSVSMIYHKASPTGPINFLASLQHAHDNVPVNFTFLENVKLEGKNIARRFNLEWKFG